MPAKRSGKSNNSSKKSGGKRSSAKAKKLEPQVNERAEWRDDPSSMPNQLIPYLLGILALFVSVCFIAPTMTGVVGQGLSTFLYGILGYGGIAVPVLIFAFGLLWKRKVEDRSIGLGLIFSSVLILFTAALLHAWTGGESSLSVTALWKDGVTPRGGGVLGGLLLGIMLKTIGYAGMYILSFTVTVIMIMGFFGFTPYSVYLSIVYSIRERRERAAEERRICEEQARRMESSRRAKKAMAEAVGDERRFDPDVPMEDDDSIDVSAFDEMRARAEDEDDPETVDYTDAARAALEAADAAAESIKPVKRHVGKRAKDIEGELDGSIPDLHAIFSEEGDEAAPDGVDEDDSAECELTLERTPVNPPEANPEKKTEKKAEPEAAAPGYTLPPIALLKKDTSKKNVDITDELQSNAVKLVETLRSFKVRTKIVNVSRGPSITRYELAPEEGIRVRAIANLVDDIALNLATTGVRIEAPIPGKSAVGIEVPNKNVSLVYLRELIDTQTFRSSQNKLTAALGVDVAGEPILFEISKMPHLLIAGATGMGKSVCINSIIVSLLYKATPDEVKLILIDPKKVELNIYNGLPHLLVPVVSDPKKAAGSLAWAVTEMERRFELIEEEGVRNVIGYRDITKDDPDKEFLPDIVIIIDELADLMMTAPDAVENSICRLAQKARAAGIYLIIGTQRPSVDVITGLIKANVPSRIAFTVASQTDSRVVLDIAGAEKLIGRGDMLYAPVGSSKPRRVQGAFVSEQEVEAVVEFIKSQAEGSYDRSIIEGIEKEAEKCEQSTKKGAADATLSDGDTEGDPMLKSAIELAVDSGKISTSLIQRKLSLGYSRAAKLIDRMEEMGIVSPPEGQKPRKVLISKQDYMEMVVNRGEELEK